MAETKWCLPLFDRQYLLTNLKRRVEVYPSALQERLVRHSLWTAEFAFTHAYGFAQREDIFNAVGCLARIAFMLAQSLFALNAEYYFGDKGALEASTDFPGNLLNFPGGFKGCSRFRREIRASWSPPFAKCTYYGKRWSISRKAVTPQNLDLVRDKNRFLQNVGIGRVFYCTLPLR